MPKIRRGPIVKGPTEPVAIVSRALERTVGQQIIVCPAGSSEELLGTLFREAFETQGTTELGFTVGENPHAEGHRIRDDDTVYLAEEV